MLRHLLAPTLAAAALCAGESAPAPIVSLAVADGPQLTQHWEASLYGRVWSDQGLAWVRKQWGQQKAGWKSEPGLDIDAILSSAKGLRAEFLGMAPGAKPKPRIRVQADLGAQAQALFALMAKRARPDAVVVAGADEARQLDVDGPTLARHGTRLVLGFNCDALPWKADAIPVDLRLAMDYRRFMQAIREVMPDGERASFDRTLRDMEPWLGQLLWDSSLAPQGMREVLTYDKPTLGVLAVDRVQLDRFPADALAVAGVGLDMAALWKVAGPGWLDSLDQAMHRGSPVGAEATRREIDAMLAGLGVAGGLEQLAKDLRGTFVLGVTQGVPFPGASLVAPRSPSLDALVGVGMAALGAQPPAEGESAVVPVPNLPIMVSLARDKGHWLLSSDPQLVQAWLGGKPGGFLASAAGKAMLAKAPADACLLGAMDTAAVLRTVSPYASMGLAAAKRMPNEARQAVLAGLARLTREAQPSWIWSANQGKGSRSEAEGPLGMGVAPIAIIAAIAIPNLLESRVAANEAAAGATLRSGIFPAQIQFQAGAYMDQDEDNVGEYGTLGELSGRTKTSRIEAGQLRLLTGPLAQGDSANGYRYRMYLPDGKGAAVSSDAADRAPDQAAAQEQERFFICYAWPLSTETGRRMFALAHDGQLRSLPWDGREPAWNAALPGGWEAQPAWPAHGFGPSPAQDAGPAPDPKALF